MRTESSTVVVVAGPESLTNSSKNCIRPRFLPLKFQMFGFVLKKNENLQKVRKKTQSESAQTPADMASAQYTALLRSITQYYTKCKRNQWLLLRVDASTPVLAEMHPDMMMMRPAKKTKVPVPKVNHNQLVLDNLDKIGKDSAFHRKTIQEGLRSLGFSSLKRSKDIKDQEPFMEDESQLKNALQKKTPKSADSQVLKALDKELAKDVITALVALTPKSKDPNELSPIALYDSEYKDENHLPNDVYSEVFSIPQFGNDPVKFEQYIRLLAHSTFHFKNSSSFNGIIPKILRNLFHPLNANTINLRSANSYNHVIHFFSSKWDIATCREFLVQMRLENIKPTTTTYNIMLKNLLILKNIKHTANPYKIALKHLERMKYYGLMADVVTWNLIFKLLKDPESKSLLLENRSQLNIPLDHHSTKGIFQFLAFESGSSAVEITNLLKAFELPVDSNILNILAKKLISEQQIDAAYQIIMASPHDHPPVEPMNILLTKFSKIGRVDLVISTLNTFKNKFDVVPNVASYNLVMKSLAQSGHWNQKYEVWRILYRQMLEDLDGVITGTYWITRLRSRMKFIYSTPVQLTLPLTNKELELKQKMTQLRFEDENPLPLTITDETPESYKDLAELFGSRNLKSRRKGSSDEMKKKKEQAKDYRKRIKKLSIQKAMAQRVPYADDQFSALKDELTSRNLAE